MAHLHRLGYLSTIFIDDTLLLGDSEVECVRNVKASLELFEKLGFVVHPEKSVLKPTQSITYLGFVLHSKTMTVTLTPERKEKIFKTASSFCEKDTSTVRELAQFIGMVVAGCQGVKYGPLWYRGMEKNKTDALKQNDGNFDSVVRFSDEAKTEMMWWKDNIRLSYNDIDSSHGEPDFIIFSDASLTGWGCSCKYGSTGGHWNQFESEQHINVLELKAGLFALKSFAFSMRNIHLRLMMDNTTAVGCVNKMGTSHSVLCNEVTKEIWSFCVNRSIWLSAAYVPGKDNVEADEESRRINFDTEWQIRPDLLRHALSTLDFAPGIDLFASWLNRQCPVYVAYRPDPEATAINAFTLSWSGLKFYAFPPFCIISSMLQKITQDKAQGVVVVPYWPNQPWFPRLASMLTAEPVLLSARKDLLQLPTDLTAKHHLSKHLRLLICKISGVVSEAQAFRSRLSQFCVHPGEQALRTSMPHTSTNGEVMLAKGSLIRFIHL